LMLHRLFENRLQVGKGQIAALINAHVTEYFRLKDSPPRRNTIGCEVNSTRPGPSPHTSCSCSKTRS
jgi:hypothetical protein